MEINIVNQSKEARWMRYRKDFEAIAMRCEHILHISQEKSVSLIFVQADAIHEINLTYRGVDRPTDVISFALCDSDDAYEQMEGSEELGDIFINIEAVVNQARDYGHSLRREVCFLFTHGLLHLFGYDHGNEAEETEMFQLQDVILDEIVPKKVHQ